MKHVLKRRNLAAMTGVLALILGCAGTRPDLGVVDGRLVPCPTTPNCVSTFSTDEGHRMETIPYVSTLEEAKDKLIEIIHELPRVEIITVEEQYVYFEARSKIFGFVDDVEFYFDDENKIIHFRSASRLGSGDFGVNRDRMEQIRAALIESLSKVD